MRRNEMLPIGKIVTEIIAASPTMQSKITEATVIDNWQQIVGTAVANTTRAIALKGDTLHITLASPLVRNELMRIRQPLLQKIARTTKNSIIKHIILR